MVTVNHCIFPFIGVVSFHVIYAVVGVLIAVGSGCQWHQVLLLPRRTCAGGGHVFDRDSRGQSPLHRGFLL